MTATLAILSWGAHDTLKQTLESYEYWQLPIHFDQKLIFFQQISPLDIGYADRYGYEYMGALTNVGIPEAYSRLVERATGSVFLFLENDWKLLEEPSAAIADGRFLLSTNQADVIRYRHSKEPGNPLWTRQFEDKEYERPTHLLDSVHWTTPNKFPEIGEVTIYDENSWAARHWYVAKARNANWTNNPHMAYTSFLKQNIVPRLGDRDIELDIQDWWQEQNFKVAQGAGLFQHNRI